MESNNEIVKIEGLYDAAYRAHSGTSFSPERRAESCVKSYEEELNNDLKKIPIGERARYIDGYKKHLFAWLRAKSMCLSSMITGPANFPVRRNEKALQSEHNRSVEFSEYREKALKSIAKRIENAKPQEVKDAERWCGIKKRLESSLETIWDIDRGINTYSSKALFVSNLAGVIKTFAKNADTIMLERSLNLVKEWNDKAEKPLITSKHSIWKLADVCEANREKEVDNQSRENKEQIINGVRVVWNWSADRIQLFFNGKPAYEVISQLKKNAFKWSPSNMCWQRQLTRNAEIATSNILTNIKE